MKNSAQFRKRKLLVDLGLAGLALAAATPAFAQVASKSTNSSNTIENIVVTSQKRSQNIQDVAEAITAFSAETLEAKGIANPQDLQLSVPNLSIGQQTDFGGAARVTLRGVGSENYGIGGDPGVPIHINGHYTQSSAYVFRDMLDVQRVEVQRGPQGTLYGRNAVGGNINIITNRPTKEFEGSAGYELGNYNRNMAKGMVSGPLSENVRGRLVAAQAKRDGVVQELGVGSNHDSIDYHSVRGALEIDLTRDLQAYINAYDFNDKGDVYTRRIDTDPNNIANLDPFKVKSNALNGTVNKSRGVTVDLTWNLDDVELRSLTARDVTDTRTQYDVDGNAVRLATNSTALSRKTYTQEFQALSKGNAPLRWVTGAFFYKEDGSQLNLNATDLKDTNGDLRTGLSNPPDLAQPLLMQDQKATNNAKSWAIYGQTDYALTEKLDLITGLRYTEDTKSYYADAYNYLSNGGTTTISGSRIPSSLLLLDESKGQTWKKVTTKFGLNYKLDNGDRVYSTYSNGFKSGGFSPKQLNGAYSPETVDAYEVGYKGRSSDGKIQTNVALFQYDYKDKQEFVFYGPTSNYPGGGVQVINASKAKTTGAEFEIQAKVTQGLRLDGSLSILSAKYENFLAQDDVLSNVRGVPVPVSNLSGHYLPLSPKLKANIGAQYNWALADDAGKMSVRADYSWTDKQYGNAFNREGGQKGTNPSVVALATGDRIPSYGIWNARVQWKNNQDNVAVTGYVNNLTNKQAITNAFVTSSNVNQATMKPRLFGVKVDYYF